MMDFSPTASLVAEQVAAAGVTAEKFADAVTEALAAVTRDAVGLKSIIAYRWGLAIPARPPSTVEVLDAADHWLGTASSRLDNPTLLHWLAHLGARLSAEA